MNEIIDNLASMSAAAMEWSFDPGTVLVPTMGALHEGHLSLVRSARRSGSRVIVSIFVNPLQFGPAEDFTKYPRNLDRDVALLMDAGCDLVFAPGADDLTPDGMNFTVDPGKMGDQLCGHYRPGHFKGVATIVTKLLQIVRPGRALFGWKDAQQFLLLSKMVRDLNIPVQMDAAETVREDDGLAMSSRNSYLSAEQRRAAPVLYQALQAAEKAFAGGITHARTLEKLVEETINSEPLLELQYVELVSMDNLERVEIAVPDNALLAIAAFAGHTRLIDNVRL